MMTTELLTSLSDAGYTIGLEEPDPVRGQMFRGVKELKNGQEHHVFFYETDPLEVVDDILAAAAGFEEAK